VSAGLDATLSETSRLTLAGHPAVEMAAYDPTWPERFHDERGRLPKALPGVVDVHHIGSTSVPGLVAKPILDIIVVLSDVAGLAKDPTAVAALGYEFRPAVFDDDPDHLFFVKNAGHQRTHHLHVFAASSPDTFDNLIFRDYLCAVQDAATRYALVKTSLARRHPDSRVEVRRSQSRLHGAAHGGGSPLAMAPRVEAAHGQLRLCHHEEVMAPLLLTEARRVQRLEPPRGQVRVVVDTDAANEIDDQFALAYAMLCPDRLTVEAVYAAPFQRLAPPTASPGRPWYAVSPAEGMTQSHAEILRVLEALGSADLVDRVHQGSEAWLPAADTPVPSAAAEDLIARARQSGSDSDPLYVVTLGAPTNIASALLTAPDIATRVVVVWLGGNGSWWTPGAEYNAAQDPHASRVLLDSGVPLVHVPCYQVTEKLRTTHEEVERRVRGHGAIGDYLADIYRDFDHFSPRMKELWDLGPLAWLVQPTWCPSVLTSSPVLHQDLNWGHEPSRHLIREIRDIDADAVLNDFFTRLPAR